MKPRFAVDFDGTLIEDDKYPAMGDWIPGAADAVRKLERLGQVIIHTCRVAPSHHLTEEPLGQDAVDAEIRLIRNKLGEEGLDHLEIWTKPWKPPAAVYIDNKAVAFRGDWEQALEDVMDTIASITAKEIDQGAVTPEDDNYEAYIQDMGACIDCVLPNGCAGPCLRDELAQDPDFLQYDRHPSSARFHEILGELGRLHDEKSIGYGTHDDPLANVRASEDWGISAWQGAMIRACDKVKRLQSYAQKGSLPFEAIEDAFKDLAVYSVIGLVLFEQDR